MHDILTQKEEAELAHKYGFASTTDKKRGGGWQKYSLRLNDSRVYNVWQAKRTAQRPSFCVCDRTNEDGKHFQAEYHTLEEAFKEVHKRIEVCKDDIKFGQSQIRS